MSQPVSPSVVQVAVPRPLHAVYDYAIPPEMAQPAIGARVKVPFGRSETVGICVADEVETPHERLKQIKEVIDDAALIPSDLLDLAHWMSRYYHHPLGEVLATIIPAAARKGASAVIDPLQAWRTTGTPFTNNRAHAQRKLFTHIEQVGIATTDSIVEAGFSRALLRKLADMRLIERCAPLNEHHPEQPPEPSEHQARAIDTITGVLDAGKSATYLLEGVTGSGKTEVYLRAMQPVVDRGGQVLVLVPEIALTPQTLKRFEARFSKVGMAHSHLSDRDRFQTWLKCKQGELQILIGTRSAIFTPFDNLGLIIVDEEHDGSYKQQDGLRYSARDLAAKRGHELNIPVVFGSATPSLESLHNVDLARYQHLTLPVRAGGASMPSYHTIDMRGETHTDGLSLPLQRVISTHLDAKGQILLFLNRRGFSPSLLCTACGWQAQCPHCDAKLTVHLAPRHMACHHCGLRLAVPSECEACKHPGLLPVGMGTQRTEATLGKLFPDKPIYRIDRDTTRTSAQLEQQLDKINSGDPCLMVGTQMLAKGHHFPNVTLVAVLNADAGFLSTDFRAPERTAQLIVQVAGRAGRAQRPGEVWVQTFQPDNPQLTSLINEGYAGFARKELQVRKQMGLAPHQPMAMLRADAFEEREAFDFLNTLKQQLRGIEVLGPVAAPLGRVANRHRVQVMLVAQSRASLHSAIAQLDPPKHNHTLRWSIDIDPYDTM